MTNRQKVAAFVKRWDSMMRTYEDKQYVERFCTLYDEDKEAVVCALKVYLGARRASQERK